MATRDPPTLDDVKKLIAPFAEFYASAASDGATHIATATYANDTFDAVCGLKAERFRWISTGARGGNDAPLCLGCFSNRD